MWMLKRAQIKHKQAHHMAPTLKREAQHKKQLKLKLQLKLKHPMLKQLNGKLNSILMITQPTQSFATVGILWNRMRTVA